MCVCVCVLKLHGLICMELNHYKISFFILSNHKLNVSKKQSTFLNKDIFSFLDICSFCERLGGGHHRALFLFYHKNDAFILFRIKPMKKICRKKL